MQQRRDRRELTDQMKIWAGQNSVVRRWIVGIEGDQDLGRWNVKATAKVETRCRPAIGQRIEHFEQLLRIAAACLEQEQSLIRGLLDRIRPQIQMIILHDLKEMIDRSFNLREIDGQSVIFDLEFDSIFSPVIGECGGIKGDA